MTQTPAPYRVAVILCEETLATSATLPVEIFRNAEAFAVRGEPGSFLPSLREADDYLVASIRSFVDAVHSGKPELFFSGHDLRQALEAFIAPLQPFEDAVSQKQSHHRAVLGLSGDPTAMELTRAYAWFTAVPLTGAEGLTEAGFRVTRYKGKLVVIERIPSVP